MPGSTGGEIRMALERALGTPGRAIARPLLQPRVHRARQRRARHAAARHDPHRSSPTRRPVTSSSGIYARQSATTARRAADELRQRRAHQDGDQHVRDDEDLLRQHAGRHLRATCQGPTSTWSRSAVGSDSRIGAKYLKGAIGYGGPCFPRDNVALRALARSLGAQAPSSPRRPTRSTAIRSSASSARSRRALPGSGRDRHSGPLVQARHVGDREKARPCSLLERLLERGRHGRWPTIRRRCPSARQALRQAVRRGSIGSGLRASCLAGRGHDSVAGVPSTFRSTHAFVRPGSA